MERWPCFVGWARISTTGAFLVAMALAGCSSSNEVGRIAFVSEDVKGGCLEIHVMAADGTGERLLTRGALGGVRPAWSPDGRRIAFQSDCAPVEGLYVISPDGADVSLVVPDAGGSSTASWSPDGSRLAFTRRPSEVKSDIYTVNVDGTQPVRLTDDPSLNDETAWSPDGESIAFESDRDGMDQVYVMAADGSGLKRISDGSANDHHPAWSPDGTKLAFASDRSQKGSQPGPGGWPQALRDIYVMDADGSDIVRLTSGESDNFDPFWSPDGERIGFTTNRDGNYEIYAMKRDGSGSRRLTDRPFVDGQGSWSA